MVRLVRGFVQPRPAGREDPINIRMARREGRSLDPGCSAVVL